MNSNAQRTGSMGIVIGSFLFYVLVALISLPHTGSAILGVGVIAISASGLLYGRRGGLLGAGLVVLSGVPMASAFGVLDDPRTTAIRAIVALCLGWLIGLSGERAEELRRELVRRREAERELQATATRLEGLVENQHEFVATVSHELRTPLTGVVGFAETLRDGFGTLSEQEMKELVALIADQAADVADIVEDLLVGARLESGQVDVHPEMLDLDHEVSSVLASGLRDEDGEDIPVEFTGASLQAFGDPQRVRQILRNLLTNAMRYGAQPIVVNPVPDGDDILVRVIDHGSGVPADHEALIFEPYHRAAGAKKHAGSVGLGLTVSHQLAHLMNGDLTYHRDGERTVFTLKLPARALIPDGAVAELPGR